MLLCNAELVSYISLYVELVVAGMSRLCNCACFGGSPAAGEAAYKKITYLCLSVHVDIMFISSPMNISPHGLNWLPQRTAHTFVGPDEHIDLNSTTCVHRVLSSVNR
jgi:hypothetical protein